MSKDVDQLAQAFWVAAEDSDESAVVDALMHVIKTRGMNARARSVYAAIEKKAREIELQRAALVTTAYKLDGDLKKEIESDMDAYDVQFEEDEDVIGGLEIVTHDRRIAGTISSMLGQLRAAL